MDAVPVRAYRAGLGGLSDAVSSGGAQDDPRVSVEWSGPDLLEGLLLAGNFSYRPISIELDEAMAEVYWDGGHGGGIVKIVAVSPVPAQLRSGIVSGACVSIQRSLRGGELFARGCVTGGELTGESAVDAAGGEWVFIAGNEGAGWARAEDVGL